MRWLFKVRVLSILVYGAESWKMTKRIVQKIRGFIVRCFTNITLNKTTQGRIAEERLSYKARYTEAMCHIDIIYLIDRRRARPPHDFWS